jgi:hypothetical protein
MSQAQTETARKQRVDGLMARIGPGVMLSGAKEVFDKYCFARNSCPSARLEF